MAGEIDPKAAEDLAKSVQAIKASTQEATKAFEDQLRIITQMRDVMNQMAGNMGEMNQTGQAGLLSPDGWEQVSKQLKNTTQGSSKAATAMEKLGKIMKSPVTTAALALSGAFVGLGQGFKNLFAMGKGIFGLFGSVASGAMEVAKSIVAIPFKMLDGLFNMAQRGGDNSYAQALEEVRDQFGSLKSESSKTVLDVAHNMDKFNNTGVSAWQIFGNMAERIKAVNELAKGMGATFQVFQGEIEKNGAAIMRYQRGLGITDEQMQSIASNAMRMGKGIEEVQNDMTKQALGMSKAFGVNAKVISRDMAKAMQDLSHFGHLSTKEMAVAATFANKLGVSVDKLTGIMDATATFDQAAEGMSKLNEQFGTNIDATKMMMAQTPQEKVEMLRKEFARTGKDMSKLTMQERMLIKQSSGMSDELLNAAFSAKNAGVSLDKMNKQGDKNESKTLSQADAMKELADSIKRLTPSGSSSGGFLDHIIQGFSRGIQVSPVFMKLMRNINVVLREATMFGVKLGRMFVDLFPGVKDVFGGLGDIFNPNRFRKMFGEVMKTFDVFKAGGTGKMEDFMKRIKEVFLNFFNSEEGAGKKVLDGFSKFGQAAATVFGKMSEWIMDKLAGIIVDITEWIRKPKMPNINAAGVVDGIKKPFDGALKTLSEKLWPAIQGFGEALFDKIKDGVLHSKAGKMAIAGALTVVLLPAITGLIGGLATAGVFKRVADGIVGGGAGGGGITGALQKAAGSAEKISSSAAPGATAASEAMGEAVPPSSTVDKIRDATKSEIDFGKAAKFLAGMAGLYGILGGIFMAALKIVSGVPIKDLVAATLVIAALSATLVPVTSAANALSKAADIDFDKVMTVLTGIAGMMAIGLGAFGLALLAVKKMKIDAGDVAVAGLIMLGVGEAMLIALGIIKLATLIQDPTSATVGLVAMGVVLLAMGATALAMAGLTKLFGASEIASAAKLLSAVSEGFAVAAAVALVSMAAGAVIISSGGLAGGALLVGLGAISTVVGAMADTAMSMITKLNDMPMAAGFETKAKAFTDVMNSISTLAGQIGNILKGLDFGFFESEESKIKKMETVKGMIQMLFEGSNGQGGLKGIIVSVEKAVKDISPDKIGVLSAMGSLFTAAGGMISSMIDKIANVQGESTRWFQVSNKADDQAKTINSTKDLIEKSMTGISSLIAGVSTSLNGIANPEAFAKVAATLGPILTAAGQMVAAIMPNMEKFQKETSGSLGFSKGFKSTGVDTEGISSMVGGVTSIMTAMSTSLPALVNSLMGGIGDVVSRLDEKQLKALPVVGDIIKSISTIIDSVTKASAGAPSATAAGSSVVAVSSMMGSVPSISQIIFELGLVMPQLIKNMITVAKSVPEGMMAKVKTLNDVFDSISKLINTVAGVKAVSNPPDGNVAKSVLEGLSVTAAIISGMIWNWTDNNKMTLKQIFEHLGIITRIKGIDTANEKAKTLADIMSGLGKLAEAFKPIKEVGDANVFLKNLSMLDGMLWGMLFNWTNNNYPTLQWIFEHLQSLVSIKGTGDVLVNAKKLSDIFSGLDKLTQSIDPITKMRGVDPNATLANMSSISTTLDKDHMQKHMEEIVKSVDVLSNQKNLVNDKSMEKIVASLGILSDRAKNINAQTASMPPILDNFFKFADSFNKIKDVKLDDKGVLAAVTDMVQQTRQLDIALGNLPKISLPAKLDSIAKGMGLGGKFAYTVQSKEVIINVEFNVTMEVDKVEKVLITRTNSVIRDRINFAIKNAAPSEPATANAYIRSQGQQGPNVASDVGH